MLDQNTLKIHEASDIRYVRALTKHMCSYAMFHIAVVIWRTMLQKMLQLDVFQQQTERMQAHLRSI